MRKKDWLWLVLFLVVLLVTILSGYLYYSYVSGGVRLSGHVIFVNESSGTALTNILAIL